MQILIYSHDTYGLGHIRRSLALAQQIQTNGHNIIILTGSPIVGRFPIPQGIDFVRIPGMIKQDNDLYVPHSIKVDASLALKIRRAVILATAKSFRPDLFLVDKAPLGLEREVLPTLRWLHKQLPATRVVLGLRDIMDTAESTIHEWQRKKIYGVLEELYSEIWVYGEQKLYDPIKEYRIPPTVASKVYFTGYIPRPIPRVKNRTRIRKSLGLDDQTPFVLVTIGGGGDGYKVIDTFLSMMEQPTKPAIRAMIVTGPLLSEELYDAIALRAKALRIRVAKFYRKMERLILASDCVISMGGYNTICEIICAGRPSLILPRCTPREEQLIRARIFANQGLLEYIPWDKLEPMTLRNALIPILANPQPYTQALNQFPMNAFHTINQRIAHQGEPHDA